MTLQQSASFGPLVRALAVFGLITVRASDNKVRRIVRAALRNRYHMVNMISATHFFIAVIAFSVLTFVLTTNIGSGVLAAIAAHFSTSVPKIGAPVVWMLFSPSHVFSLMGLIVTAMYSPIGVRMFNNPLPLMLPFTISLFGRAVTSPFALTLVYFIIVNASVSGVDSQYALPVRLIIDALFNCGFGAICFGYLIFASFALRIKAAFSFAGLAEVFESGGFVLSTFGAAFNGDRFVKHSASLSLSPMESAVRAVGLTTFSGINLDCLAIIPHNGAKI